MSTIQRPYGVYSDLEKAEQMLKTAEQVGNIVEEIMAECLREKYQQCCHRTPVRLVTYDCSPDDTQTLLVCQFHYTDEQFQTNIVREERLD